jgi:hypothetical protein
MAARKARRPFTPYVWTQVRRSLFCALGGHDVPAGEWVRYRRDDHRGLANCERCLQAHGITRPPIPVRPFTMTADGEDVRARQTGDPE